jgi:hypothetical protein
METKKPTIHASGVSPASRWKPHYASVNLDNLSRGGIHSGKDLFLNVLGWHSATQQKSSFKTLRVEPASLKRDGSRIFSACKG